MERHLRLTMEFDRATISSVVLANSQSPLMALQSSTNVTDVQNIFSRVTGSQLSNIDGILKTQGGLF